MKFTDIVKTCLVLVLIVMLWRLALLIIGLIIVLLLIIEIAFLRSEWRIKRFMRKHEGKYFLWYSSRKELKGVIETELKPLFDFEYHVVYNNRNTIESLLTEEQLRYLRNHNSQMKLPIMIRIKERKVLAESFYTAIYQHVHKEITKAEFENQVNYKLNKIA